MGDPSASEGAPIEKLACLGCLLLAKHLLFILSQNLPGKQFYHLILFLPHKIAPKKILHRKSILALNQLFRIAPLYPSPQNSQTSWFNIFLWRPKVCFPPSHVKNNVVKNRVARFPTKIDLLKLKSNCWFRFDFWTAHGFEIYLSKIFINYLILLSLILKT